MADLGTYTSSTIPINPVLSTSPVVEQSNLYEGYAVAMIASVPIQGMIKLLGQNFTGHKMPEFSPEAVKVGSHYPQKLNFNGYQINPFGGIPPTIIELELPPPIQYWG